MKLDTQTKTLTLEVGETVTLQCVAAAATPPPVTPPVTPPPVTPPPVKSLLPLKPEHATGYNEAVTRLKRVTTITDLHQQNAEVLYQSWLAGDANWAGIRQRFDEQKIGSMEYFIQAARDGNMDDLNGVLIALDEWLKANGFSGVV